MIAQETQSADSGYGTLRIPADMSRENKKTLKISPELILNDFWKQFNEHVLDIWELPREGLENICSDSGNYQKFLVGYIWEYLGVLEDIWGVFERSRV